jgi:hypothetical protein
MPYTLFHNDCVHGSGAVGLAVYGLDTVDQRLINAPYQVLGSDNNNNTDTDDWLTVTRCQGNIVMQLDGQPALQPLLQRLHSHDNNRLAQFVNNNNNNDDDGEDPLLLLIDCGNELYARRITGGDPAGNGHFAVESMQFTAGMRVRFARLLPPHPPASRQSHSEPIIRLRKIAASADEPPASGKDNSLITFYGSTIEIDSASGIVVNRQVNTGDMEEMLQVESVDGTIVELLSVK